MLPTFVIIGAAKAGTTALYWYLADHPEVFMSPVKETNYFAFGLDDDGRPLYGDPELHRFPIRSFAEYEALFAGSDGALAVGEASPIYLECPQSAARIREVVPGARIVCFLREPVDRAYSDYLMYLRARGRRLDPDRDLTPDAAWARPDSHWMQISRYHEALSRYYERFPREQIDVFLFDDLKTDAAACVRAVFAALGVDPGFAPDLETPHNIGGLPVEPNPRAGPHEQVRPQGRRALDPAEGVGCRQTGPDEEPEEGAPTPRSAANGVASALPG